MIKGKAVPLQNNKRNSGRIRAKHKHDTKMEER
jgi:hypothetical protein